MPHRRMYRTLCMGLCKRTNEDGDWRCAHEAANHNGGAITAVGCQAAREVVRLLGQRSLQRQIQ